MNRALRIILPAIASAVLVTAPAATSSAKVLEVTEHIQQVSQWCWAAVSRTMLEYYGINAAQCDIAEYTRRVATWHNFGTSNCCDRPYGLCNYWNYLWGYDGSIQDIMVHFGSVSSRGVSAPLSLAESIAEIDARRPFIVRWGLDNGGGHFVVAHGADADGTFYYMDPWFGEGFKISTYDQVLSGSGHEWSHTGTMTAAPCECRAIDECCDGCAAINEGGACDADGSGCTIGDKCSGGTCVPGPAPDCTGQDDQCNDGVCLSTGADTYSCGSDPAPLEGRECNADDDGCTVGDSCASGTCVAGPAADCPNPAGQCHEPVCLSQGADVYDCTVVSSTMDGAVCDDGDPCTIDDVCGAGVCTGRPRDCSDGFACTLTWCDPVSGECVTQGDDSVCDDGNACTLDHCLAGTGCINAAQLEWRSCNGPGFACFSGHCKPLASNDTFETAVTMEADKTYYVDGALLHPYLDVPSGCLGNRLSAPDAFFTFRGTTGVEYTLTMTPDDGVLAAVALWDGVDEEAACANGIDITGSGESVALPDSARTPIMVQTLVVDISNATGPTGVTLLVTERIIDDQAPEMAEPGPMDAWSDAADASSDSQVDSTTDNPIEPADTFAEPIGTDTTQPADARMDTVATDGQGLVDADTPVTDALCPENVVTPETTADGHIADASAADALPPDRDHGGSGCSATSRGALPAMVALIFLVAMALAIPGLVCRGRRD